MDNNKSAVGVKRKRKCYNGNVYGLLTVIEDVEDHILPCGDPARMVLCKCECGREKIIMTSNLTKKTISCGCLGGVPSHRLTGTRFYNIWTSMQQRCGNKKNNRYGIYGARGITVCEKWSEFSVFKNDMYKSFLKHVEKFGEKNTTIDRIDSNGNYEPSNCRWATYKEQSNNRRNNKKITFNGETLNYTQWGEKLGLYTGAIWTRLNRYGWTVERALTTPSKKRS